MGDLPPLLPSDDEEEEGGEGKPPASTGSAASKSRRAPAPSGSVAAVRTKACGVSFERVLEDLVLLTFLAGEGSEGGI